MTPNTSIIPSPDRLDHLRLWLREVRTGLDAGDSVDRAIAQADQAHPEPPDDPGKLRENQIDLELAIADTGIDEDDGVRLAKLHAEYRATLDALARRRPPLRLVRR